MFTFTPRTVGCAIRLIEKAEAAHVRFEARPRTLSTRTLIRYVRIAETYVAGMDRDDEPIRIARNNLMVARTDAESTGHLEPGTPEWRGASFNVSWCLFEARIALAAIESASPDTSSRRRTLDAHVTGR